MPRFDLSQYETVEERIRKFYADYPDGRIITENLTTPADRAVGTWVVRSAVYLTAGDQANNLPKATGLAFEIDGGVGANQTSALENAETSSIGRSLANAGYSGQRRASRSEMDKVERVSAKRDNWLIEADKISDLAGLRWLYAKAKSEGASPDILERIETRAKLLSPDVESPGAYGGLSDGPADGADK
jgi:hypothetical protein